nr:IPT/TIG domain-containing protein [uncultured Arsenicibacter sp.]
MLRYFSYLLLMSLVFGLMGCPFAGDPLPLIPVTPVKTGKTSYKSRVTVHSFSPDTVRGNGELTIRGAGFSPVLSDNQVYLNGKAAQVLRGSDTTLVVRVPEQAGTGIVEVQTGGQRVAAGKMMIYGWIVNFEKLLFSDDIRADIAIDESGNMYVLSGRDVIKYNASGGYVKTIAYKELLTVSDHSLRKMLLEPDTTKTEKEEVFHLLGSYLREPNDCCSGFKSYIATLSTNPYKFTLLDKWPIYWATWFAKASNAYYLAGVYTRTQEGKSVFGLARWQNRGIINLLDADRPIPAMLLKQQLHVGIQNSASKFTEVVAIADDGKIRHWLGGQDSNMVDGPAGLAAFIDINSLATDSAGRVFVLDEGKLRIVTPEGYVQTLATAQLKGATLKFGLDGKLYAFYSLSFSGSDVAGGIYRLTIR